MSRPPHAEPPAAPEPRGEPERGASAAAPAAAHQPARDPASSPRRSRARRLGRLALRLTGVLLVLALVARAALPYALPGLVARLGRTQGLAVTYGDLHLALLRGELSLERLVVRPDSEPADAGAPESDTPAARPLLGVEFVDVDVDMTELLRGRVRVRRLLLDGVEARVIREADGRFELARLFAPTPTDAAEGGQDEATASDRVDPVDRVESGDPDDPARADGDAAYDFTLPIRVDAARLQHARVALIDRTSATPLDTELRCDVRLSDLGADDRAARIFVDAEAEGVLERFRVEGELSARGRDLDTSFAVTLAGLHPRPLAGMLGTLGLEPLVDELDGRLSVAADLAALPGSEVAARGEARLTQVELRADGDEAFALDSLVVDLVHLSAARVEVATVDVRGVRGGAQRLGDGALAAAGFALRGGASDAAAAPDTPARPTDAARRAPVVSVGAVTLQGAALEWHDAAVAPPAALALEVGSLSVTGLVLDPARPAADVALRLDARVPGVTERVTVDVAARPFDARRTLALTLDAGALDGAPLAPYLAGLGLAPDFAGGDATLALRATLTEDAAGAWAADLELDGLAVVPGDGRPALTVSPSHVRGVTLAADGGALRVADVTLAVDRLELARGADGVSRFAGLRTLTPAELAERPSVARSAAGDEAAPVGDAPPAGTDSGARPRVELAAANVSVRALRLEDRAAERPIELAVSTLTLGARDLAVGGPASQGEVDRGAVTLAFAAEDLARRLTVAAELTSRPGPLDLTLDLTVQGDGLVTHKVDPWLAELGLASTLVDGRLALQLDASLRETDEGLRADASLRDLVYADAGRELLALDEASLAEVLVAPEALRIGEVTLRGPRLAAGRDADGALHALGLRLVPRPAAAETAGAPADVAVAVAPTADPAPAPAPAPAKASPARALSLARLSLEGAALAWRDEAPPRGAAPVATTVTARGSLVSLHLGEPGAPLELTLGLAVDGTVDSLTVTGTLEQGLDARSLRAAVDGAGLRAGPLAAYLPPEVAVTLADGRLAGRLALDDRAATAGGRAVSLAVEQLSLRDGESPAVFGLERLVVDAARVDPSARVYEVSEVSTAGLVLDVTRAGPTTFHALGLALTSAPAAADLDVPAAEAEVPTAAPSDEAAARDAARTAGVPPSATLVIGLPGVVSDQLPTVDVGRLALGLERFRFLDETAADATPLTLRGTLALRRPTRLIGPAPEELPPVELDLTASAPPFVRDLRLAASVSPFAASPHLSGELDVRGVSGPGLAQVLPDLAARVDPAGLTDGRFTARLDVTANAQRRGPAAFDLSRGLGLVVELEDVGARASEAGPVELGVERVVLDAPRLRPATGEFPVRALEVTRPTLHATRTQAGLVLLGVLIRPAPVAPSEPSAEPSNELSAGPADGPAPEPAPSEASPHAAAAGAETGAAAGGATGSAAPVGAAAVSEPQRERFALDELLVTGLDVRLEDTSVAPAVVLPLTDLDLEVRGLSTRPGATVSLRAALESGPVLLPERTSGDSLVTGLLSAAKGVVTGADDRFRVEPRPLWDTLQVTGRVTLDPGAPRGFVTVDVGGFELQSLRGPAKAAGVEISDGLVDTRASVRLLGERGARVETRTVFSHLFVSEPADGPISQYLSLPAPLDTVLYVLRDENEQQVVPLSLAVPPEGVSLASVLGAATRTLGQLIGEAIASSPLRLGTGALGLLGLLQEEALPPLGAPLVLSFGALDGALDEPSRRVLADVARDVRAVPSRKLRLHHELGGGDVAASEAATTLDPNQLLELADALAGTRDTLTAQRDEVAAAVRGQLAVGRVSEAEALRGALVELDERLAETEAALDQVLGLTRGGTERTAARRARAAAVLVGEARLAAVRDALVAAGVPPARIELRRARASGARGQGGGRVLVEQR